MISLLSPLILVNVFFSLFIHVILSRVFINCIDFFRDKLLVLLIFSIVFVFNFIDFCLYLYYFIPSACLGFILLFVFLDSQSGSLDY